MTTQIHFLVPFARWPINSNLTAVSVKKGNDLAFRRDTQVDDMLVNRERLDVFYAPGFIDRRFTLKIGVILL